MGKFGTKNPTTIEFERNLDEALRWCRERFSMHDLDWSLRSPELRPSVELSTADDPRTVVDAVIVRRRELLMQTITQADPNRIAFWGLQGLGASIRHHLLAVFPAESLSDGTSPPSTGGFIDVDDVPAWDTWVFFDRDMLVTLVPPELVAAVQVAIDCNAYDCIGWLGFRDHPLVEGIRKAAISGVQLAGRHDV